MNDRYASAPTCRRSTAEPAPAIRGDQFRVDRGGRLRARGPAPGDPTGPQRAGCRGPRHDRRSGGHPDRDATRDVVAGVRAALRSGFGLDRRGARSTARQRRRDPGQGVERRALDRVQRQRASEGALVRGRRRARWCARRRHRFVPHRPVASGGARRPLRGRPAGRVRADLRHGCRNCRPRLHERRRHRRHRRRGRRDHRRIRDLHPVRADRRRHRRGPQRAVRHPRSVLGGAVPGAVPARARCIAAAAPPGRRERSSGAARLADRPAEPADVDDRAGAHAAASQGRRPRGPHPARPRPVQGHQRHVRSHVRRPTAGVGRSTPERRSAARTRRPAGRRRVRPRRVGSDVDR